MLQVSAYSSRELLAVLRGLRNLDRDTKKALRANLRPMVTAAWKEALAAAANTRLEQRALVDTGRTKVSDQNVRLTSATVGRSLSGGLWPSEEFGGVEFGARPRERNVSSHRGGTRYSSTRNTTAQLKAPNRRGHVVYPAAASVIPRVLSMFVQTFIRGIHEALEGRKS
jgi:hypothetical protein